MTTHLKPEDNRSPIVPMLSALVPNAPRVALLDDHPVLRAGIRQLLELDAGCLVDEFGNAEALMRVFVPGQYRVLLLDLSLPDRDGLTLLPQLRERDPALRVIVFTMHDGAIYRTKAQKLGADALVSKREDPSHLLQRVLGLLKGQAPLAATESGASVPTDPLQRLTPREREICLLLARGHTVQRIANLLGRSEKTVFAQRTSLFRKLDVRNDVELALWAQGQGVV